MRTYRAPVDESFDVRTALVAQILIIGSLEVQRPLVTVVGVAVSPGHWTMAVVGKALTGVDAKQPQESQLDDTHRFSTRVNVCKLKHRINTSQYWEHNTRIFYAKFFNSPCFL